MGARKWLRRRAPTLAAIVVLVLTLSCSGGDGDGRDGWIATWSTALHGSAASPVVHDQTVRQIVRCSVGGGRVRVRLSNLFGTAGLRIERVTLARSRSGSTVAADSLRRLTFGGEEGVSIPAGDEVSSDAVDLAVAPREELAFSFYFRDRASLATAHGLSRRDSYLAAGDQSSARDLSDAAQRLGWFALAAVEVWTHEQPVVVAFGDSITDGFGASGPDGSWPQRLVAHTDGELAVLNLGISGNRVLASGTPTMGPSALDCLDRDVLAQTGASILVLQEGINDIQAPALPAVFGDDPPSPPISSGDLIAGLRQIIARARAAGFTVVGGTLLP
jgi:hypothetical protein